MEINNTYIIIGIAIIIIGMMLFIFFTALKRLNKSPKKEKIIKEIPKVEYKISDKIYKENDLKENKFYNEAEPRDFIENRNFLSKWWIKRKLKKQRKKIVLVRMRMNNTTVKEMLVKYNENGFIYNKKRYLFDPINQYLLINSNIRCFDYQESLDLPIILKAKLPSEITQYINKFNDNLKKGLNTIPPIDTIKTTLKEADITTIDTAINPSGMEQFLEANLVTQLVQAITGGKILRIILFLAIAIGIIALVILLINLYSSGILEDIGSKF